MIRFSRLVGVLAATAVLATTASTASATRAQECEFRNVTDTARVVNWVPPHVGGDHDFGGNGPAVSVRASLATLDSVSYTDTDHADDVFAPSVPNSFVDGYRIVGDTTGDEAGTETFVQINIKPITLRLSRGCP